MRVLLVSTYELGHQPLHVASPAAALRQAGHDVRTLDLAVEGWDDELVGWAEAVAFSVPMHTAMRLALEGAALLRRRRSELPVCLYGLYALTAPEGAADVFLAGEYEPALVGWVEALAGGARPVGRERSLARHRLYLPARGTLPPLERYARLVAGDEERLVGAVETTHGCLHRCRHCPLPTVYDGRTRRVPAEIVLDDVARLVEMGARHITFADADFLNRREHALAVVRAFAERFAGITFDITTKVEHVLRFASLLPELAAAGCLFVVSAYECVNDRILRLLDKGHTSADAALATELLRASGIEPRPSWLPFTPWSTVTDVADILDFVLDHELVANVDPIQYTIRLLIPRGSLLLELEEIKPYLGPWVPESLSYDWRPADERTSALQQELVRLVAADPHAPPVETFRAIAEAVYGAAGRPALDPCRIRAAVRTNVPRLTEPWFCCAEPTQGQLAPVTGAAGS